MESISLGSEGCLVLSQADAMELRQRMSDTAIRSLANGRPEKVSDLTIDGRSLCIVISTVISTPMATKEAGGKT